MLNGVIDLEVDYTTAKEVDGLKGLGTYVRTPIKYLPLFFADIHQVKSYYYLVVCRATNFCFKFLFLREFNDFSK